MIGLIQRVSWAKVEVEEQLVGQIEQGILVLVGMEKTDQQAQADKLLQRLLNYRIFADNDDKMNLSVKDIHGGLLLVPQFTLAANTKKGLRPSFSSAKAPSEAEILFHYLLNQAQSQYSKVAAGQFGADMKVSLLNDGPVTFSLTV
ncbi:MAG: D-tyrosyl-tRNA(Tyr) deacylase [gamma proteobacterium symbiont of Bathyaustriella thionipta]|nr:D-tyrosyl-tRNA(Tyr) deacylase [gamma proteobacterium symbiont of Bathyaustriella thionipta]MCU7951030.1 D-tyrosyl-tRNA(Tyr) deacylase [gamma proteobacterium symbiont of Bathyaustriella thionipta]MCU7953510.1 D-tyrosyl-tRNA(Tyr) deacylase [gamma proteobacterium symbiont of Bathyaustriella thionipta]MCU7957536.1 D-tyrosyl-tRNA(Tyr) deacylase [gamma proteobacterium symbiont of Bathyaustriella thionipta]MCU7969013.1 D-tyrosyl-tRNA(Tyr) deacylase [gamma proteobacterium symbiont of Bathyaustriella